MNTRSTSPSEKIISRLSLYRRLLIRLENPDQNIYSHNIARLAGVSAAQVRRDLMVTGYAGSPNRGYDVEKLITAIGSVIDAPAEQPAALVGTGHLGRAILNHFFRRESNLKIIAAFDSDPQCQGEEYSHCTCFGMDDLEDQIEKMGINLAIMAIPPVSAQEVASRLVRAGIRGIVNFAPIYLDVPEDVYVIDIDITTSIETAAYFARK
jgi:redox-sensing transcriptional repressor